MNVVVVRSPVSGSDTVAELLDRVAARTVEAFAHPDAPFERVATAVRAPGAGEGPLTSVMFNYLNLPSLSLHLDDVRVTAAEPPRHAAKFDLDLYLRDDGDGIELLLEYDRARFRPDTARQLLTLYTALVERLPDRLDGPVSALELPVPGPGPVPLSGPRRSVVDRFAETAAAHPDRTAVWRPDGSVTYRELAARVAGVAAAIGRLEPRRSGAPVGVLCRDPGTVPVAFLSVLAAGHVVVGLDPDAPAERLAAFAADAGLVALVADRDAVPGWAPGLPVVVVDEHPPVDAPLSGGDPDATAYLIFTSGSEGRPKAVAQTHGNVVRHVDNYVDALSVTPRDRLTLLGHYTFDAAVLDLFAALLTGAALCPADVRTAGTTDLAGMLAASGATVYHSTPTLFRHLAEHAGEALATGGVRAVVLGGEQMRDDDVSRFTGRFPAGCRLWNLFGAAECTLVSLHEVDPDGPRRDPVPVGHPVPGIELELTGPDGGRSEPFGRVSCRGEQVFPGYWDTVAGAAVPFGPGPCHGDLLRRLPDGTLQFVARADDQLKIRGVLVAPAEVEACLRACDGVAAAAVAGRTDPAGELHLVGYVVPGPDGPARDGGGLDAVRAALRRSLPAAAVPDRLVRLDALPRTRTGKLDRRGLPDPPWGGTGEGDPPATPTERAVAGVWADVLGRDAVARHDDFFELGGHSLLATAIIARLRDAHGAELSLRQMFDTPTVAGIAAALDEHAHRPAAPAAPAITRRPRVGYRVTTAVEDHTT